MEVPHINTRLLTRGHFPVRVIRAKSPTLFWVQPKTRLRDFQEFQEGFTWKMDKHSRDLTYFPHQLAIGETVAIKEGKHWQRGVVLEIRRLRAIIILKDWGRSVMWPTHQIYHLKDEFRLLPWQAIPCGLAQVEPTSATKIWSPRTNELFRVLTENQDGWIKIRLHVNSQAAFVDLDIGSEGRHTDLQRQLVDLGFIKNTKKISSGILPSIQNSI